MIKSRLNNYELRALEEIIGGRIHELVETLGLDLQKSGRYYVGCCPIHRGDNISAFNVFHSGNTYIGNWACYTHHCHEYFKPTVLGLIRAVISSRSYDWRDYGDVMCPFRDVLKFAHQFVGDEDFTVNYEEIERNIFCRNMDILFSCGTEDEVILDISRDYLRSQLVMPANYYLNRGFSQEILDKYDVGLCFSRGKQMNERVVVPIYNTDHSSIIGCTGRSIHPVCPACQNYHNPRVECLTYDYSWIFRKWKNSNGLKVEKHLYNMWFAQKHIQEKKTVIIVEGASDVWKLEEMGIHNSVALLGTSLSPIHKQMLSKSGALAIILLLDPDSAGKRGARIIDESLNKTYAIYNLQEYSDDIPDLSKVNLNRLVSEINKVHTKISEYY